MEFIDTHCHLFAAEFENDRSKVIEAAINSCVNTMLLPNIDLETLPSLLDVCVKFPNNCYPMIGLHPTSVKEDYLNQLNGLKEQLHAHKFIAIGEIGIDLYWDKTHLKAQRDAFVQQIEMADLMELPIVIHSRESHDEIIKVLHQQKRKDSFSGIFHCFTGTTEQAKEITDLGFHLGIGGVVTFKNTTLHEVIRNISLENIVLETDSPYLAPVPYRGKRNESSYIPIIAEQIAKIKNISIETVAEITTNTAKKIFNLN